MTMIKNSNHNNLQMTQKRRTSGCGKKGKMKDCWPLLLMLRSVLVDGL